MIRNKISAVSIAVVLTTVMIINFETKPWNKDPGVFSSDVNQYYAYLPSIFIYNDLTLQFYHKDKNAIGSTFFPQRSPTWELVIVPTYGVSLLYLPFFLLAHFFSIFSDYPATGLSSPYQFLLQMSSWVYLLIGLLFLRRLLLKYFTDHVIAVVVFIIVVGTNFLWYVTGEAAMSHVYSFALIAVYLFLLDSWLTKPNWRKAVFLGLLVGLITLIRPTNIVIGVLALLWKVTGIEDVKNRFMFFYKNRTSILLLLLAVFAVWMPQLLYWKMIAGKYFYYSYPEDQHFYFLNPQLFRNLFSWRKGWLIYVPVMMFALAGIGIMAKLRKDFFWSVMIYFLISWYVLSSWWNWWYGGGLSIRPYIDSYAVFAVPLSVFLSWTFRQTKPLAVGIMLLVLFATWNGGHNTARYFHGSLHWEGNTKQTYLDGFFSVNRHPDFWYTIRLPNDSLAKKGINHWDK